MQRVLSIDGGGIRGIIPAMVLAEIERRTRKRIAEMFDLIAGTSTGGILALGLTKPGENGEPEYSAQTLIELYETEGRNIFSIPVWHRLYSAGGLAEEKYPAAGIEEVALRYFGDVPLSRAFKEVLITAYEIEKRGPWFFKRRHARESARGFDPLMREVARATSVKNPLHPIFPCYGCEVQPTSQRSTSVTWVRARSGPRPPRADCPRVLRSPSPQSSGCGARSPKRRRAGSS